jgi:hypothetical protein
VVEVNVNEKVARMGQWASQGRVAHRAGWRTGAS